MEPTLITRNEAMKLLRISRSTLIRLEKSGVVKAIRISERKVLYDLDDIKRLLDDLKAKGELLRPRINIRRKKEG